MVCVVCCLLMLGVCCRVLCVVRYVLFVAGWSLFVCWCVFVLGCLRFDGCCVLFVV